MCGSFAHTIFAAPRPAPLVTDRGVEIVVAPATEAPTGAPIKRMVDPAPIGDALFPQFSFDLGGNVDTAGGDFGETSAAVMKEPEPKGGWEVDDLDAYFFEE